MKFEQIFYWILANFNFSMVILSIPFIAVNLLLVPSHKQYSRAGIIYRWLSLFVLGVAGLYWFVMHVFFPDFTAGMLHWPNTPFQFEVGLADLSFGALGIIAFSDNFFLRLANVIAVSLFFGGIAVSAIFKMIINHQFSFDLGSWFWTFLFIPIILILCFSMDSLNQQKYKRF